MFCNTYSRTKRAIIASALTLGASGIALADDSSMSLFTGDSYRYFRDARIEQADGANRADPARAAALSWRQSHPNGSTERELQALSSASIAASPWELERPMVAAAPDDSVSWRLTHPRGLSEPELQALSSSGMSPSWQFPNATVSTSLASSQDAGAAPAADATTLSARLAKFFRTHGGA